MRTTRIALAFAFAVVTCTLFTACASSSKTSSTSTGTTSATASSSSNAASSNNNGELGLVDTRIGSGARASLHQCLYVHYTGLLADGRQFETSHNTLPNGAAAPPIVFEIGTGTVMPGWEKGVLGMQVGGSRRLFVPYRLAYGAGGRPPAIPPRTDLVFDIDLLAVSAPLPTSNNMPRADGTTTCATWAAVNRSK